MLEQGFRLPMREIIFNGQSLLIDVMPLAEALAVGGAQPAAGALLTLYAPSHLGEPLAALHPHHAESLEALLGDSARFARWDEVERAWEILDPLIAAWETDPDPIPEYPAGSWGPHDADLLMEGTRRRWRRL